MAENADQILHFHEYFKIIRNRLWVIFTIFALTVLSGWYVTEEVIEKEYTASSEIEVKPRGVVTVPGFTNPRTEGGFDATQFQAEFEIMQSKDVLMPVVTDLGLDKIWAKRIYKSSMDKLPEQDAMAYMNRIFKPDFKRGTDIIVLTVTGDLPQECADIANHIA